MNISPKDQKVVENCLGREYHIDFYQREYVWTKDTVETLLDDVFYQFELSYEQHKDKDISPAVIEQYNWYYLNIYITNTINGKAYIVDGQQRLTTLTLIITHLYHLTDDTNLKETLKKSITGNDKFSGDIFYIDHDKRQEVMKALMQNDTSKTYIDTTSQNINERYKDIVRFFKDRNLQDNKLEHFIYYFLERLVLVELKIEKEDTPMIFEVINDRGVALKPFEILKGKLLGSLDKEDIENYNGLWESAIDEIKDKEDDFFKDYFKAKFIFVKKSDLETRINNDYHRYIFENNDIAEKLKFRKTDKDYKKTIKNFIEDDLIYYTELYAKITKNEDDYLKYNNHINGLSGQYQNIMAACTIKDDQAEDKIKAIAKEIDRLYVLLNLNGVYNSNNFQVISLSLNENLKNSQLADYKKVFDNIIVERLNEKSSIRDSLLPYRRFKVQGYHTLNVRVLRYILARIEEFICDQTKKNIEGTVFNLATKSGAKLGYHIEHILSDNPENKGYFETEEDFWEQRNYIGGLLLLKGKDNQSSSNEPYEQKLETYSNGLMLCRTLREDCYKSNLDFTRWNDTLEKPFNPIEKFDQEALEQRSQTLYELVKLIWEA